MWAFYNVFVLFYFLLLLLLCYIISESIFGFDSYGWSEEFRILMTPLYNMGISYKCLSRVNTTNVVCHWLKWIGWAAKWADKPNTKSCAISIETLLHALSFHDFSMMNRMPSSSSQQSIWTILIFILFASYWSRIVSFFPLFTLICSVYFYSSLKSQLIHLEFLFFPMLYNIFDVFIYCCRCRRAIFNIFKVELGWMLEE